MLPHSDRFTYPIINHEVIDGDTVRVTLDLGFHLYHQVDVRVMNVDTPEVRHKNAYHKAVGHMVAEAATHWLAGQNPRYLRVESAELGKYRGRVVGDVYVAPPGTGPVYLSNQLLAHGMGQLYTEPKTEWTLRALEQAEDAASKIIGRDRVADIRKHFGVDQPRESDE